MLPVKADPMDERYRTDELAGLRQFLERLESGSLRLRRNHFDVTKIEIGFLKLEIGRLERILGRAVSGNQIITARNDKRSLRLRRSAVIA